MKTYHILIALLVLFSNSISIAQSPLIPDDPWDQEYNGNHHYFINYGQVNYRGSALDPVPAFYTLNTGYNVWLLADKISFSSAGIDTTRDSIYRIDVEWTNSMPYDNPGEWIDTSSATPYHYNYYLGHMDSPATNVKGYGRVVYTDVSQGVDFQVFSNKNGFKCAYVAEPHADLGNVDMTFSGQKQLWVDSLANLGIITDGVSINLGQAYAYQCDATGEITSDLWTPGLGIVSGNIVKIDPGEYNPEDYLVVVFSENASRDDNDPVANIGWSSYWGDQYIDQFQAITSDTGNFYVTGSTTSPTFPEVAGANATQSGSTGFDVVTLKVDNNIVPQWGTFIGGDQYTGSSNLTEARDEPNAIQLDGDGDVYVAGFSEAEDFPVFQGNLTYLDDSNYCDSAGFCSDAFIAKLDGSNGQRLWISLYGDGGNESFEGLEIDANGNIYCVGIGSSNTPMEELTGAYNEQNKGSGLVVKFDDQGDLLWATRFGSSDNQDVIFDIVSDNAGGHYIAGQTAKDTANDFPIIDPGVTPIGSLTLSGGIDGFVARLDHNDDLDWSYFVGGLNLSGNGGIDAVTAIDRKGSHNLIAVGKSNSTSITIPMVNTGTSHFRNVKTVFNSTDLESFLLEIDTTGKTIWGTYIGTNAEDEANDVHVAANGVIYVGGTAQGDSLTGGSLSAPGYFQRNATSGQSFVDRDGYILAFSESRELLWTTYYGSGGLDQQGNAVNGSAAERISALATTQDNTLYTVGNTQNGLFTDFILVDHNPNSIQDYFQMTPSGLTAGDFAHAWGAQFDVSMITNLSVTEVSDENDFMQLYPNPAIDRLFIQLSGEDVNEFKIYNSSGQVMLVHQRKATNGVIELNLSELNSGLYIIESTNTGKSAKFIVRK